LLFPNPKWVAYRFFPKKNTFLIFGVVIPKFFELWVDDHPIGRFFRHSRVFIPIFLQNGIIDAKILEGLVRRLDFMGIDLFTYLALILKIGYCRRAQLTGEVPHHNIRTSQSQ
jgi:hypothetical protein